MSGNLNCRPGDLAVVIKSLALCRIGVLVTIVSKSSLSQDRGPTWLVRPESGAWMKCGLLWLAGDANLRPIRSQPGDDETLAWAGKPKKNYLMLLKECEKSGKEAK